MTTYQLIAVTHETSWEEHVETPMYRGNKSYVNLKIPTVEAAHQIALLAGITSYIISDSDDTFGHETLFKTQDIIDFENKAKSDRDAYNAKMEAKVEQINATPRIVVYKTYGDVTVVLQRTVAEYHPAYSSRLQVTVNVLRVTKDAVKNDGGYYDFDYSQWGDGPVKELDLLAYKTKACAWQRVKFLEDYAMYIGKHPGFEKVWDDREALLSAKNTMLSGMTSVSD